MYLKCQVLFGFVEVLYFIIIYPGVGNKMQKKRIKNMIWDC